MGYFEDCFPFSSDIKSMQDTLTIAKKYRSYN